MSDLTTRLYHVIDEIDSIRHEAWDSRHGRYNSPTDSILLEVIQRLTPMVALDVPSRDLSSRTARSEDEPCASPLASTQSQSDSQDDPDRGVEGADTPAASCSERSSEALRYQPALIADRPLVLHIVVSGDHSSNDTGDASRGGGEA